MRHFAVLLGAVSFVFVLSPVVPAPRVAAAPVPTHLMPKDVPFDYPTEVGTTWVYDTRGQDQTITISKVEDKDGAKLVTTEYVKADGTRSHHMTLLVGKKGVFLVSEHGSNYPVPWCIFKLPHKEGDTWKTEGHGGDMTAGPVEKVKIPTGEVLAARVEWDSFRGQKTTYWYSNTFGLVRMAGGGNLALKSFTRGKD